ncbi:regulator of G-protein signaling 13 [Arvicola amphibius]|uniref:regulator of G-protein signaling 13 n=1 Tax=Arvicola amphibius TaxID=1047088 RepID=UPI001C0818B2|nr:regulator of G-protein signaling 13 [Arvicola amphibius]
MEISQKKQTSVLRYLVMKPSSRETYLKEIKTGRRHGQWQEGVWVNTCFGRIWETQQHAHLLMTANTEEVIADRRGDNVKVTEKYGPVVYTAYLKLEHSDENIKFWMACETYKKIASRRGRISRAKKLYSIYIQPQSPKEINIDSSTRDAIIRNIQEPTQTCFEEAQKIVYMHMEMDSYPRFLKSEMYQNLLKTVQSQSS